jgi:hypothetical protein
VTAWLILAALLMVFGGVTQGAGGFVAGGGVALVILPFWFVGWLMFAYEPEPEDTDRTPYGECWDVGRGFTC